MLARYWIAPVGLFLFQVAPVGVRVDSVGRYRLAFGGALGSYEETSVNCEGQVTDRQRFKFRSVGGEAEAYVAPKVRVAAHAGRMSTTAGAGNLAGPFEGFYGGAMVGYEGEKNGVAVGISTQPVMGGTYPGARNSRLLPIVSLRQGRSQGTHGFLEVGLPTSPGGPPELFRAGIGHRWGQRRQAGVQASFGMAGYPSEGGGTLAMVVRLPVVRFLDLGFSGVYREPNGGSVGMFGRLNWW